MSNKKLYTCQANKFGNIIVCGDEVERNSYEIASLKNKAEIY
jgi:hypothetical protein